MRIIIIDDESGNLEYMERTLRKYNTVCFMSAEKALDYLRNNSFDIVISDQKMPELSGIECIQRVRKFSNDFIGIIISAHVDTHDLIEAVNSNIIYKYIIKPFVPDELLQNVYRAEEILTLRRNEKKLENELKEMNNRLLSENRELRAKSSSSLDSFIGFHPLIYKLKEKASIYAGSEQPVLITGETGTGKELLARAIHSLSGRSNKSFVAVNCSAFSENLLESELFGHEKGAFTGASDKKKGLLQAADMGTLFLDEIGDFPINLQAKILRVVQFGTFYPVGSNVENSVNVRIISATNKNIMREIENEKFRRDLFYRINSLRLNIPPLRERADDILHIIDAAAAMSGISLPVFSDHAKKALRNYDFPGNVRELENFVEKFNLFNNVHKLKLITEELVTDFLEEDIRMYSGEFSDISGVLTKPVITPELEVNTGTINLRQHVADEECRIIKRSMKRYEGNISRTARSLSLSRQGLKNKLKRYGINADTV